MTTISKRAREGGPGASAERPPSGLFRTLPAFIGLLPLFALLLFAAAGCREDDNILHDGFYTAEADAFGEDGWKDYLTIYVNNGQITIVEFDAFNLSGFRRSWDMEYQLRANVKFGPRVAHSHLSYQSALLTLQDAGRVQPLSGAKRMHQIFTALADGAIRNSRANDKSIAYVKLPENAFENDL
jgi:major membrane immunogen (membrane-anchored lipoprotein)